MMWSGVMFGWVVGKLMDAFFPEDVELLLVYAAVQPSEAHVVGIGHFLFHCSSDDATSGAVVSGQWCWRLWLGGLGR